jgi:hypothetical protein
MFLCMRTTININDRLLRLAKQRAAATERTLTAVIEDALRLALEQPGPQNANRPPLAPPVGEGGLQPGVDLDNNAALLDVMEGMK